MISTRSRPFSRGGPQAAPRVAACLVLALGLSQPALGGVFKCLRDDGRVFYQEDPCPPGRELRDFDRDPANVSVVPFARPRATPPSKPARAAAERHAGDASARPQARAASVKGDASQRRFLRPGMSEGEVIARVGSPDMTARRTRKSARWTYMPVPEDRDTITNLVFENGTLSEVERKVIRK